MTALVVMFPDFRGEGLFGNFGESLIQLENLPKETVFVPILNGDAQSSLLLKANRAREKGFKPVISLAKGASAAIIAGYQMVATKYP
ncbi:MAG: hypothetical protein ACE5K0_13000, partial [Candidatus Methanofastidiosia archaeon]